MKTAKYSGIELSPHIKKFNTTVNRGAVTKTKKTPTEKTRNVQPEMPSTPSAQIDTSSWQQLLLSKFPELDPNWPDDVKAKWFDGFKDLMGQFKK